MARQIITLRIAVDHSACNRFINSTPATLGIPKISTWHTRHTTPVVVIVAVSISISIPILISIAIAITVMTITTMRIMLVIT